MLKGAVVRCHLPRAKRLQRSTINNRGFLLACRIQHRQTRKAVLTIREEKSPCWTVQFMISKHACPWPARKRRKTGRLHSDKTRAGALQIQRGPPRRRPLFPSRNRSSQRGYSAKIMLRHHPGGFGACRFRSSEAASVGRNRPCCAISAMRWMADSLNRNPEA
jgi:hypothetical protein